MPRMTLTNAWVAGGRITADVDTAVLIRNTNSDPGFYEITGDDTAPDYAVLLGQMIWPSYITSGSTISLTLRAGERLWLASGAPQADFTVTTRPA